MGKHNEPIEESLEHVFIAGTIAVLLVFTVNLNAAAFPLDEAVPR
jgi:hypothetical protein